jgi:hypothetical protein
VVSDAEAILNDENNKNETGSAFYYELNGAGIANC